MKRIEVQYTDSQIGWDRYSIMFKTRDVEILRRFDLMMEAFEKEVKDEAKRNVQQDD